MVDYDRRGHDKGFRMLAFCFGSGVHEKMDLKFEFGLHAKKSGERMWKSEGKQENYGCM